MRDRVKLLGAQMAEAYGMIRDRVEALSEPASGAWTVHPDEHGRWFTDYEEPDPC